MQEDQARTGHARTIGLAALTVALMAALWAIADVLLLLFGALLFSLLLGAAADWVAARTGLSRGAAFALVTAGVILVAAGSGWAMAGRAAGQIEDLSETLPRAASDITDKLRDKEYGRQLLNAIGKWQAGVGRGDVFGRVTGVFSSGLGILANIVILGFGTLYLAADPGLYRRGLILLFPPDKRARIEGAMTEAGRVLRAWLLGKLLLMAFVAVVTGSGLAILGVPLAPTLGLIAGILDFVPNFGPLVAFGPAAVIALSIDPMLVVWTGLLYYAVQVTENYILTPVVQRHASNLAPAVIIFSQIALGVMFGVLGVLFAEPLAAAVQVLVKRLYVDVQEGAVR